MRKYAPQRSATGSSKGRSTCEGRLEDTGESTSRRSRGTKRAFPKPNPTTPTLPSPKSPRSKRALKRPRVRKEPSTAECPPPNKRTTSRDKSKSCKSGSQTTRSSKTSRPGSTSSAKGSRGFWNASKKAVSAMLWSPTEIGLRGSVSSSSSGLSSVPGHISSFSTKRVVQTHPRTSCARISSPSSTFSLAGSTDAEGIKLAKLASQPQGIPAIVARYLGVKGSESKTIRSTLSGLMNLREHKEQGSEHVFRMLKVQILPTENQRRMFRMWVHDARRTYNVTMAHVLREKMHRMGPDAFDKFKLRIALQKMFVAEASLSTKPRLAFLLRTPKVIRQKAVYSVVSVLVAHVTNVMKNPYQHQKFNPGFKRRTGRLSDTIELGRRSIKSLEPSKVAIYPRKCGLEAHNTKKHKKSCYFGREVTLDRELPPGIVGASDFKIHLTGTGRIELLLPQKVRLTERPHKALDKSKSIALDPGVRKFLTGYSPDGEILMLGLNASKVIRKCLSRVDRCYRKQNFATERLKAAKKTHPHNGDRRARLSRLRTALWRRRKQAMQAREKMRNVVKNFHYRCAHTLLRAYDTIVLPWTTSHYWIRRRNMSGELKRTISALSFGSFATRLKETATFYPGRKILRGSESYTSKQCFACGHLNPNSTSERFECAACPFSCDRDAHGAANIYLKFASPR